MIRIYGISIDRFSEWAKFSNNFDSTECIKKDEDMFSIDCDRESIVVVSTGLDVNLINKRGDTFLIKHTDFLYIVIE